MRTAASVPSSQFLLHIHNLYISSVCDGFCVLCMWYMYLCVHTYECECIWKSKVVILGGLIPHPSLFYFVFETGSLTRPTAHQFSYLASRGSPDATLTVLWLQVYATIANFSRGCCRSKHRPSTSTEGTLVTEPSPQPQTVCFSKIKATWVNNE